MTAVPTRPPTGEAGPVTTPAATEGAEVVEVRSALRRSGVGLLLVGLAVAVVVVSIVSAGVGQYDIPADEVLGSLLHRVGIDWLPRPSRPFADETLWVVRFPRVVMAALVGAALATAGALMQGVFGNPLAEPGVVGVSTGAAVGASAVIAFRLDFAGLWSVPIAAFAGGLVTTVLVYLLSRAGGRTEVVTLVLTGIAVNAVGSALLALLVFMADTAAREDIVFWQLGTLNTTIWPYVGVAAALTAVGLAGSFAVARRLDLLALGERPARHLGVDVERLRVFTIVLVVLLTAGAVSFVGIIGFVGLVVPHLVRLLTGPGHRVLLPASALGGALVLAVSDLVARTAVDGADLPIGILTALVGGPFFFWLLRRTRRTSGGWA